MMEIRTVINYNPGDFDSNVNSSIAEGWHLTKRELVQTPAGTKDYLYAELVKVDEPAEPVTWQEAAQVLKSTCSENDTCDTCKLREWCDEYLAKATEPQDWEVPAT